MNLNPRNLIVQKIASSKPGAWVFQKVAYRLDRRLYKLTDGRHTLTSLLTEQTAIILTTTGAKSGLPRQLPLLVAQEKGGDYSKFAIIASNFGQKNYPSWYFNLKANPEATCSIKGQTYDYIAREAEGEEYARYWAYATNTYMGYALYAQRIKNRRIPIMIMERVDAPPALG